MRLHSAQAVTTFCHVVRPPRERDEDFWDWRRRPPLPVVFETPTQMTEDVGHLQRGLAFVEDEQLHGRRRADRHIAEGELVRCDDDGGRVGRLRSPTGHQDREGECEREERPQGRSAGRSEHGHPSLDRGAGRVRRRPEAEHDARVGTR